MSIQHIYSQTVADGTATSVVRPSDWNSVHNMVLNVSGNTVGTSQISGSDIIWAGGNNVTLSANGSTVTIVGPNTVAQTVQTQASGNIVGAGFTTTTIAGAVVAATQNSAGLLMAVPSYLTTAQSPGAYLTTAMVSNAGSNFVGLNSALTANGVSATINSSGLSLNFPAFLTTAAQVSHSHNFATTTTNGSVAVVATTNSAGATVAMPPWITTYVAQTNQTVASGNIAGTGYTSTTQAGTTVGATHNTAGLSMAWPPFITTYVAQTTQTQPAGNIAGVGTTFGGTNVSGSMTLNSNGLALSLSAAAPGGGGAINVAAGTTNGNLQTLSFVNGSGVSWGLNGSTITASVNAGGAAATGFWFQPEVFGSTMTSTHAVGTLYLRPFELDGYYDADKYIFQQSMASSISTGAVTASVSAGSASSGTGTWGISGTVIMFSRANTNETNASYNSIISFASNSYSMSAGYSSSVSWSTNVSSCSVSFTTSAAMGFIKNIDATGGFTTGSTGLSGSSSFSSTSNNANSFSSTYAMTFPYAHMSGVRPLYVQAGVDMVPGEYWIGHIQSSNSGSTNDSRIVRNAVMQPAMLYFTISTNNYMEIGNSVAITTSNFRPGFGSHSASSLTTGQIGLSQVSTMASNASMYFALDGRTL